MKNLIKTALLAIVALVALFAPVKTHAQTPSLEFYSYWLIDAENSNSTSVDWAAQYHRISWSTTMAQPYHDYTTDETAFGHSRYGYWELEILDTWAGGSPLGSCSENVWQDSAQTKTNGVCYLSLDTYAEVASFSGAAETSCSGYPRTYSRSAQGSTRVKVTGGSSGTTYHVKVTVHAYAIASRCPGGIYTSGTEVGTSSITVAGNTVASDHTVIVNCTGGGGTVDITPSVSGEAWITYTATGATIVP